MIRPRSAGLMSGRTAFLACTAIASSLFVPVSAHAQNAAAAPDKPQTPTGPTGTTNLDRAAPSQPEAGPPAAPRNGGVEEIVVTAQKREQRLQDVPVAITALTQASLQANRVMTVTDLSGLAPNVTVRPAAGGSQIPAVTSRGITSYGVVPGSDKEFSIYLDGVYLGSNHSLFDLPDIERIEVLRGPQGTLFGRNSTAGAVSVVTRDPAGTLSGHQDFTFGNLAEFRTRTTIDSPTFGPFSAYVSYVHDEHRGDIKNLGFGTKWDRTGPDTRVGAQSSPRYLGGKNQEQVFAALKFEPSDNFTSVYKFDYQTSVFTPEGQAPVAYVPDGVTATFAPALGPLAPLYAAYFNTIIAANNPDFNPSTKRPNAVNNSWTVAGRQKVYGHNLTSNLRLGDGFSLKNIASYRYNFVTSASQLDGLGGLIVPTSAALPYATFLAATGQVPGIPANFLALPAATQSAIAGALAQVPAIQSAAGVGQRLVLTSTNAQAETKQYSDELQGNYTSRLLTLTVGGLYFHQKDVSGGPVGIQNTVAFGIFPADGRIPLGTSAATSSGQSNSYNKSTSIAAYGQAEIHATHTIDVVLGGRVTHDRKSGDYIFGGIYVPPAGATMADPAYYTGGTLTGLNDEGFKYHSTKFTYSAGVNYKPSRDLLIYAKYSTGFVSGGSIAGIGWKPETVDSAEGGIKADLFDRKLRANLALFHAKYQHIQSAQGGTNLIPARPEVGVAIADIGTERAQGAEIELTAVPVRNLTFGANGGFTDAKYTKLTPVALAIYGSGYKPTLLPKFTSNLYAQYNSDPIIGDARLVARVDADWRSKIRFLSGSRELSVPEFAPIFNGPARWILNTRVGIDNLGPAHLNIAFWTRNLTNNKDAQFPLAFATYLTSASFQQARTYGLDVSVRF